MTKKNNYTWEEYLHGAEDLVKQIINSGKKYSGVFGIPRGGLILAKDLAVALEIPFMPYIDARDKTVLVADDICDSGTTLGKFNKKHDTAVLFQSTTSSVKATYSTHNIEPNHGWVIFPWEHAFSQDSEGNIIRMLQMIGEEPSREGLKDTPKRVAKMWNEIFKGYITEMKPDITVFPNGKDGVKVDEMITDTAAFFSQCEHHMLPFFGEYYFAYIPGDKIIGLSKVARVVDYCAAKLQVQERLTKEILDMIEEELKPQGCALILKGRHLCKEMRGVRKVGCEMTTSDMRGVFKTKPEARAEFLSLIK